MDQPMRSRRYLFLLGLSLALSGCGGSPLAPGAAPESQVIALYSEAAIAVQGNDLLTAKVRISSALELQPRAPAVLELAGDIEQASGNPTQAIIHLSSAIRESPQPSATLFDKLGRIYMASWRPFDAMETLKEAVDRFPNDRALRTDLAGLMGSLGLEPYARPHLQWLIMRGYGTIDELSMISDLTRSQADQSLCEYAIKHYKSDLRPNFPLCRDELFNRKWAAVARILLPVTAKHPEFLVAQAHYARALAEMGDLPTLAAWAESMPPSIEDEPQYWMARGIVAEIQQKPNEAVRAFWQACRLEENDAESLSRLAHSLFKAGLTEPSKACAERAGKISRLRDQVDALYSRKNNSQSTVVSIAKTLESLGRYWEAAAWLRVGATMTKDLDPSLPKAYENLRQRLTAKTPWQDPKHDIAKSLDFHDWPIAEFQRPGGSRSPSSREAIASESSIRFKDVAAEIGMDHLCKIKDPEDPESGVWIYQTAAGGAAVIDYDLDGWPDVCLSALDGTPLLEDSSVNQLYRNLTGRFTAVTPYAQLVDRGFTQGFAVSDINMDGFDDLYVANIGANHIYLNCGDGTFRDATEELGLIGSDWTSSAAFVDLDQDGLVDLFEVHYCDIREAIDKPCSQDGRANPCLPTAFSAREDRVWQGQNDGRFVERTDQWLASHESGRGFGLVTGFLDDQPGIDVYVANDMSANHFWSSSQKPGESFLLNEQAYIRGLAVDRSSRSQASMGIAAGDPDRDGDVDFYLTHFAGEYNTYYEQASPGIWADVSESNGHAVATNPLLGFGTQFIDADNSGTLELMIANGHVYNYESDGIAYRMPSQLMQRSEDGHWTVLPPDVIGEFFSSKHISRSLANLDFNRDGLMDCVMTHIFDPISILENQSISGHRSITLTLKSTKSHADAIGAKVSMSLDGKLVTMQLIGGSGFQASNQRCLHFGLGDAKEARDVRVLWPSGDVESFGDILAGGEWLLVEGERKPFGFRIGLGPP